MATRSFPATFTGMLAPFLIWAAHFGVVYGINGLICARGLDGVGVLGFPLAPVAVTVATLLALLWVAALLVRALRGDGPAAHVTSSDPRRFARWFTVAGAGAALIAIFWVGLPALQLPACG